jgi:hypothetical protein
VHASRATTPSVWQFVTRHPKMTGFEMIPKTAIGGNVKSLNVDCVKKPFENSKWTPLLWHRWKEHSETCISLLFMPCTHDLMIDEKRHCLT